ncbi:MAG TPA: leucyl aminopeptidase [Solirubrobacteraceae bacterium]|nr:leucyl aminopeptidase [Solirubrobacteraceae bacterium]
MEIRATTNDPPGTGADTIVVGVFDGKGVPHDVDDGALGALVESGEARSEFRALAHAHAAGRRWILIGLGARDEFDGERARIAAATALGRARELGARTLCWELPHKVPDAVAGALVEGTLLAAYRYSEFKSEPGEDRAPEALVVSAHHDVAAPVEAGRAGAEAANRVRDLGNAPANVLTPEALAARARQLDGVQVEVMGRAEIEAAGMGAFAAVAQGAGHEPQLITLRHEPRGARGPLLGLVGKAVTFDTGGYSIKPAARMHEMKFDMCGGAAVLEATGAIAQLALPVRIVGVIGATENMVSSRAARPGDIVRTKAGITIELNNTDAEGRMVLADCLTHARDQGAERLLDIATLTGAIVTTFGSVHAGLLGNDDDWCAAVTAAGEATGERVWRLPLDPLYDELIKGRYADVANVGQERKAMSIAAAALLHRFAGDVPWAHLDIAGVADDLGRPYARKGASGWGVRLLVELARTLGNTGSAAPVA